MMALHFELVSPEKLLFSGDVDQVDVPGVEGDFGVLEGHAPTVATLRPGILTVFVGGKAEKIVVLGGFAEVSDKGLTVVANLADSVEDFDKDVLASRISDVKAQIEKAEPGSALDKLVARLDHFKEVDRHLDGTAMH
jgi:F-type H+-transporting ATPase subunit epsilon